MSILIYVDETHEIYLTKIQSRALVQLGKWPAHNEVASNSKGVWPKGVYRFSYYNAHAEAGLLPAAATTSYGGTGIYVFDVPERSGMGVHAGRSTDYSRPGGKTMGCVRVPTEAMLKINEIHASDPITHIVIVRAFSTQAYTTGTGAHSWSTLAST